MYTNNGQSTARIYHSHHLKPFQVFSEVSLPSTARPTTADLLSNWLPIPTCLERLDPSSVVAHVCYVSWETADVSFGEDGCREDASITGVGVSWSSVLEGWISRSTGSILFVRTASRPFSTIMSRLCVT